MATSGTAAGVSGSGTVQTGSNGSTYITGISTGLNTQALIDAGYNQKLVPYTNLNTKITNNTNIISSYATLQRQAQLVQDAFDQLQSTTKSADITNVFYSKSVSYTASDSSTGSNIVSATTTTGATSGTHKLVVSKLAQPLSVTSDAQTSSTTALGYTGSFTIQETGKTASVINVTATSSLSDIVTAINNTTATSGVKADLLQVAGGGYKLVITSNDTAKAFTATATSGTDILQSLGVTDSSGTFVNVSQEAQQADFTLDGTRILSDSNTLNNVLTGLNLQLNNAAPSTTVTITLGDNTSGVTNALNAFVTAYNTLRSSLDQFQKTNSDGTVADGAYLANDAITRQFEQSLKNIITKAYNGSTYYSGLGAIGLTLDENNEFSIDTTTLNTALTGHFSDVQKLFQTNSSTTGLADAVYALIDNFANDTTGQFKVQSDTLTNTNTTLQAKANAYLDTANAYKTYLINKYATLEASVSKSQILIAQVKAILDGSNSNNN